MAATEQLKEVTLVTNLGVVAGEILTYLEENGATSLNILISKLESSSRMVVMAVGSLIRQGLVVGVQRGWEIIVEPSAGYGQAV